MKKEFEKIYNKAVDIYNKNGLFIDIGFYYNTEEEKRDIMIWLKYEKPFELYPKYDGFENKDRDIQIKVLLADDSSRGNKFHAVLYPKNTDRKTISNIIEPSILVYSRNLRNNEYLDILNIDDTWEFTNTY